MRQSHLPGIELPPHPEIEEAAQDLKEAKEAAKAANVRVNHAEEVLIARMEAANVVRHRFSANGDYIDVDLSLPNPSVRVKVTSGGNE